jgi:hypothetical protein
MLFVSFRKWEHPRGSMWLVMVPVLSIRSLGILLGNNEGQNAVLMQKLFLT